MAYISGNKIGEYVHWRYANYMRYGLSRKLSNQSSSQGALTKFVYEARQEAIGQLRRINHQTRLKELEEKMQYIMGKRTFKNEIVDASTIATIQKTLLENITKIATNLTVEDIDWTTLSLTASGKEKIKAGNIDMNKLIEEIEKISPNGRVLKLTTLKNRLKSGNHNIADFRQRINNTLAVIQSIGLGQQEEQKLIQKVSAIEAQLGGKTSGRFTNTSLIDELTTLARETIAAYSVSQFEGEIAEQFVALAGSTMAAIGQKAMSEVVGGLAEKNIIKSNDFMKGLNPESILGKGYRKSSNGLYWETINDVQGKVDVNLTIDENIIGASIKNYDLSSTNPKLKGVKLVSNTNLLYLFANKAKFLNHYLNQTVDTAPVSVIQEANEMMKLMILLSAFAGGGQRLGSGGIYTNRADIFVINDKSQKYGIKVFSISELFETIIQSPNLYGGIQTSIKSNQRWSNKFYTEDGSGIQILNSAMANKRIEQVLAQVHSQKISASIGLSHMQNTIQILSNK